MTPTTKFFGRAALIFIPALIVGSLLTAFLHIGVYRLIPDGFVIKPTDSMIISLYAGVIVGGGLLIMVPLLLLHYSRLRKYAKPNTDFDVKVIQERALDIPLEMARARKLCTDGVKALPATITEDMAPDALSAKTRRSLFSSKGEAITIRLTAVDAAHTCVQIESRPVEKVTLIDFGKNYVNVEKLLSYLDWHGNRQP